MDKKAIIRQLTQIANRNEIAGAKMILAMLKAEEQKVNAFVKDHGIDAAAAHINNIVLPQDVFNALNKYYQFSAISYAKWQYGFLYDNNKTKSLGGDIQRYVNKWLIQVQAYIHTSLGQMIQNITDTTRKQILDILSEAKEKGYGYEKTASIITDQTAGAIGKARALVIARTEGTRTASLGHKLGSDAWAKETGAQQYKQWIPIVDNRTRPDHLEMDDTPPIPAEELFNVGGNGMDAPGDVTAPPDETINCRCRAVYLSERMVMRL